MPTVLKPNCTITLVNLSVSLHTVAVELLDSSCQKHDLVLLFYPPAVVYDNKDTASSVT